MGRSTPAGEERTRTLEERSTAHEHDQRVGCDGVWDRLEVADAIYRELRRTNGTWRIRKLYLEVLWAERRKDPGGYLEEPAVRPSSGLAGGVAARSGADRGSAVGGRGAVRPREP